MCQLLSDGVTKFIGDSMEQVKVVHGILNIMKHNLSAVQDIANKWDWPMIGWKTKLMEKVDTPAKRDISLFATWINLFTSHMCGWIVATLSVDKSMSHMADYGMNWWQA